MHGLILKSFIKYNSEKNDGKEAKMRHPILSMLVFMLIALFAGGIIGFSSLENLSTVDAFHTTVSALTFSSDSSGFSAQGKLLNSALALASVAVIAWVLINFYHQNQTESTKAEEYFKLMPQDEGLVLKEIKIEAKSHLAGLRKVQVLQKTGTVVLGVKKGGIFEIGVPMERVMAAGSSILILGSELQLKEVEKEAKK